MTSVLDLTVPCAEQAGRAAWKRSAMRVRRDLDAEPDLLVVGAGVAGLAVAAEARRRGLDRVLVIDGRGVALRASGRNAGALIPDAHALTMPVAYARLARRGLELHRSFHERWAIPLRHVDWLVPIADSTEPPGPHALARSRATVLDGPQVEARLGPRVGITRAVRVPDQALTDPVAVTAELAVEAGGVAVGVEALAVGLGSGRVEQVTTTSGTIRPRTLVIATGRAPEWLVPGQTWVKGHLAVTEPAPLRLDGVAIGGPIVVMPLAGRRLLLGGTREHDHDGAVQPEVVSSLREELARLLPAAAGIALERVWTAQRPASQDGMPVIDRVPGVTNAYVIAGLHHSGLCTAPAIAEAILTAIERGDLPEEVRAFAVDR